MLKNRILETLRFFDLQDYPLTLLELQSFLLPEKEGYVGQLDVQHELQGEGFAKPEDRITASNILKCLDSELGGEMKCHRGFYCLRGRGEIVRQRLLNYLFGIFRERRIRRFGWGLKFIPFVRGVSLAGSQVMGQQKKESDIDLFIVTDNQRMWLARTLVTAYFQVLGLRRHGPKVANRFCLNHYVAGGKKISQHRNFYTALEYAKLRPLVYASGQAEFIKANQEWLGVFFPNWQPPKTEHEKSSRIQSGLEKIFSGKFGEWLEQRLKAWQLPKIKTEKYILVEDDELSFHPDSKQEAILSRFFKHQSEEQGVAEKLIG